MLNGEQILCFGPDPWGSIWQDKPGLMRALARHNLVVYFEPRPHLPAVWQDLRGGRIGLSDLFRRRRLLKVEANLYVYRHPFCAPISGREPLRTTFRWLREALWGRSMRQLAVDRPILWLYQPSMLDLVGRFNESFLIYFVVDEYTAYPNLSPEVVQRMRQREKELVQRADLVFTTAATLRDDRLPLNPHTYWIPNGVDAAAFTAASEDSRPDPDAINRVPRPRLGVLGSIGSKMDMALLHSIASERPHWSLVLVGPVMPGADMGKVAALQVMSNVHFLGSVPPAEVPYYIRACDVGLIPYLLNMETHHVNPLKVYEYLAMGLPVVSTPLPNLGVPPEMVRVAEGTEPFTAAVAGALAETDDEQKAIRRRVYATTQTWEVRAEAISQHIQDLMAIQ